MLERRGIISGYEGSKPRRVLVDEAQLDRVLCYARPPPPHSFSIAFPNSKMESEEDAVVRTSDGRGCSWSSRRWSSPSVRRAAAAERQRRSAGQQQSDSVKVGLVTDTGGVDDRGFNQFSIEGLNKAEDELGIETRVYVSNSADDYVPNLTAAVDDGNDLVIAVGFLLAPSTIKVAKAVPGHHVRGRRPLLRRRPATRPARSRRPAQSTTRSA